MSEITLKNYMEDCVLEMISKVTKDLVICKCEKCKMDIAALALNQLPAKYVATRKGNLFVKLDSMQTQFGVDIITAVSNAVKTVGDNPQHGK